MPKRIALVISALVGLGTLVAGLTLVHLLVLGPTVPESTLAVRQADMQRAQQQLARAEQGAAFAPSAPVAQSRADDDDDDEGAGGHDGDGDDD